MKNTFRLRLFIVGLIFIGSRIVGMEREDWLMVLPSTESKIKYVYELRDDLVITTHTAHNYMTLFRKDVFRDGWNLCGFFVGHDRPVTNVQLSSDGKHIISLSQDGVEKNWPI